jgi:glycerol-3-phosphate acyltransferase PlsY
MPGSIFAAMTIIAFILSYFLGAIPFGVLVGKARGVDVRAAGSGNSGATNVWRTLGPAAGLAVFALDVLKGLAAPYIARVLAGNDAHWIIAVCAVLAILGHTFSVFLKFRGGKGIATGLGAALGLMPIPALVAFAVWLGVLLLSRMISVASIAACIALPIAACLSGAPTPFVVVITIIALLAIVKHFPNMQRILAKTEPKIHIGRKPVISAANASVNTNSETP